jgi:hypothetical protein
VRNARLALTRLEWACVAFAVIVAHAFLAHEWFYPSAWDATSYVNIAREIAERGLFSKYEGSGFRTYGYPLVLSFVLRVAAATGASFVVLLFGFQFLAYSGAALFLRHALAPISATAARIVFCGLLLNYYALIYTPESLTESLSLSLLVLAAGWWATLWRAGVATWPLLAGSLTVGFACMVRPANAFMIPVWVFGVALLLLRERAPVARVALCLAALVAAVAAPTIPQVRNNVIHYAKATPMVSADLGLLQQSMGVRYLKYATALPPVTQAPIHYDNPLYMGTTMSEASPWSWYIDHPWRGVATVALHTFNLTDQDLLFTYSRDLSPWYRVPLGIVNHAVVALGGVGLILLGLRMHSMKEPRSRDAYVMLVALIVANWAVYAWTAVEMRFGSVLLLVLFPLAAYGALRIAASRSRGKTGLVAAGVAGYIVLALLLSEWVRDQSPLIRETRLSRAEPSGARIAGSGCCAPATAAAAGEAAPGASHSQRPGFAG